MLWKYLSPASKKMKMLQKTPKTIRVFFSLTLMITFLRHLITVTQSFCSLSCANTIFFCPLKSSLFWNGSVTTLRPSRWQQKWQRNRIQTVSSDAIWMPSDFVVVMMPNINIQNPSKWPVKLNRTKETHYKKEKSDVVNIWFRWERDRWQERERREEKTIIITKPVELEESVNSANFGGAHFKCDSAYHVHSAEWEGARKSSTATSMLLMMFWYLSIAHAFVLIDLPS